MARVIASTLLRLALCGTLLPLLSTSASGALSVLARDGRTDYTIVHASDAADSERLAVSELVEYLRRSTGATFPVLAEPGQLKPGPRIVVGPCAAARTLLGAEAVDSLGEEEFDSKIPSPSL